MQYATLHAQSYCGWKLISYRRIIVDVNEAIKYSMEIIKATLLLLIVLDPVGLLPLVVGITCNMTNGQRRKMLTKATLIGLVLLLAFTLAGNGILSIFGITIPDLKISGGILLLIIALSVVLNGQVSSEPTLETGPNIGVVPIATPLLVGPGSITTALLLVGKNDKHGLLITSIAVVLAFFVTWIVLRFTTLVYKILGASGSDVIGRIMGILLAALAVNYIRQGVVDVINSLH